MTSTLSLSRGWRFRRLGATGSGEEAWQEVDLPHIPFTADLDGREHWFGLCEYERTLVLPADAPAGHWKLYVGAAMQTATVLIDGAARAYHAGGYLPFEIDLTESLADGASHRLTVHLDNRHDPEVPPGKPYEDLDFCWYGGLYRDVELRYYPPLHITDPIGANAVASGGIFVRTLAATPEAATACVETHLCNASQAECRFALEVELLDGERTVARAGRRDLRLNAGETLAVPVELTVDRPRLWEPEAPALYLAQVTVRGAAKEVLDRRTVRCGLRRIAFSREGGFTLNGRRRRLRGTNRHQEYPIVGYAVPPAAQRRDARRIKEAGFDYVRLCHYPQSPAFLDACDELGIVVMNCVPGWQFMGGERFRTACYRNARDLIRRDRNHPCVVLWELSLNETTMDDAFMDRMHAIGHEEYPGDQMFTCGWQDRYDVFIHSRQHGMIHRWRNGDKALVIAEYGDWEFYADSNGFNQKTGAGVYDRRHNARQRRADGERGLRQQADNHLVALNDTLSSPAVFDGQWSMFDYARGYDPHRAACGVMDVFRLPKFSYHFYRSQRDATEGGTGWNGGPVVFIASHWLPDSNLRVPVFTNCEEVELRLDGVSLGRLAPWHEAAQHLPHPPCLFTLPAFHGGTLEATGYIHGKEVAIHRVATPLAPRSLTLAIDTADIAAEEGGPDVLIAHASVVDERGTLCVRDDRVVTFAVTGDAAIVGPAIATAEAGIASIVLRLPPGAGGFTLAATSGERWFAELEWQPTTRSPAGVH